VSRGQGVEQEFTLGKGQVPVGLENGVRGMKAGLLPLYILCTTLYTTLHTTYVSASREVVSLGALYTTLYVPSYTYIFVLVYFYMFVLIYFYACDIKAPGAFILLNTLPYKCPPRHLYVSSYASMYVSPYASI
jgi:hypothetical protein